MIVFLPTKAGRGLALQALAVLALGAALSLVMVSSAHAFERTQTCFPGLPVSELGCRDGEEPRPIFWDQACISWRLNEEIDPESPEGKAIRSSFDTWNNEPTCSYLQLIYAGTTDQTEVGYDCREGGSWNTNQVNFVDDWTYGSQNVVALTSVTYEVPSGRILDADIEFNDDQFIFGVVTDPLTDQARFDIQNVMTHEVGHFVGLDHTLPETYTGDSTFRDATMFAQTSAGEIIRRDLDDDDIAGICEAYPIEDAPEGACEIPEPDFFASPEDFDGTNVSCPESRRGCSCSSLPARAERRGDVGLLGLLLATTLLLRRRRAQ